MKRNRTTVAVIGEGITEKYFVQSLRDVLVIKPNPVKPKNSTLKELETAIKSCVKKGYSRVYCLIDMDNKVHDGNRDHERNADDYAELKQQYHDKLCKCPDGSKTLVSMIESFPATEVFFRYYFGYTSAPLSNQQLKNMLNKKFGYLTEEKYLIKHSLHDTLEAAGGSLRTAIMASKQSISSEAKESSGSTYTEIGIMLLDLSPLDI